MRPLSIMRRGRVLLILRRIVLVRRPCSSGRVVRLVVCVWRLVRSVLCRLIANMVSALLLLVLVVRLFCSRYTVRPVMVLVRLRLLVYRRIVDCSRLLHLSVVLWCLLSVMVLSILVMLLVLMFD